MSTTLRSKSNRERVLATLSQHRTSFVVAGKIANPSSVIYSIISRKLDNGMDAQAVHNFLYRSKEAVAKYEEWGISTDHAKENVSPKPENSKRTSSGPTSLKDGELCVNLQAVRSPVVTRSRGSVCDRPVTSKEELRPDDEMKFMENFDPEKSKREQRKLNRKFSHVSKKNATIYDDKGIHTKVGLDLCDCLNEGCEGCFFPCSKCRSLKCGHECRQNRRWMYESYEVQGTGELVSNKYNDN